MANILDVEALKWFWSRANTADERAKVLQGVANLSDPEALRWFLSRANTLEERAKILKGLSGITDPATLKWFLSRANTSQERAQVLQAVANVSDPEALKWFLSRANTADERARVLRGVANVSDPDELKWFLSRAVNSDEREKVLDSISGKRSGVTRNLDDAVSRELIAVNKHYEYDVFISHASEDKDNFVRPLASELRHGGLRVWYDEFTLSIGDSLRRSIDRGLASSRFGLVVLSRQFFSKEWPQKELDGLVAREDGREKVILPIWHGLSREDVQNFSPLMADRLALSSAKGVKFVSTELMNVIKIKKP